MSFPDSAAAAITASSLHVIRGRGRRAVTTLHPIDFSLPAGSITGLIGPSGAGKTTLMRALIGTQRYAGEATVLGEPAGSPSLRGRIGYATQQASIYDDLTVAANLSYFARLSMSTSQSSVQDRVTDTLQKLGMADYANRPCTALSGGQRGRVSLGCAIINRPEVIILDEPTVGLDPLTRENIWEHLHSLAAAGATLIVSSHVLDEATHCDSMLLLREGKLLRHSTPADLLATTGASTLDEAFLTIIRTTPQGQDS